MNSTTSIFASPAAAIANGPKVGDILCSTWGYEASIASFAKVVAVTGKSIKMIRIGGTCNYTGPMEWTSMPDVKTTKGKVETKRFVVSGNSYRVKDSSFANFYVWGGEPVHCYNYH